MKIIYYEIEETASTNLTAKELKSYFCTQALTVVFTTKQSHGQGQFGKTWHSTDKDFTASFCFFIRTHDIDSALLFRLGTEAVQQVIQTLGISTATVKWPNDILVNGKKLSGVLCETSPVPEGLFVIVGIGINGNTTEAELGHIDQPAISLRDLLQQEIQLHTLKEHLSQQFYQIITKNLSSNSLYF